MSPDIINGMIFELGGSIVVWRSVFRLWKDKKISGVSWTQFCFFFIFGAWNCAFYPYYDLWWSFAGGVPLVLGNLTWLILAAKYANVSFHAPYLQWSPEKRCFINRRPVVVTNLVAPLVSHLLKQKN